MTTSCTTFNNTILQRLYIFNDISIAAKPISINESEVASIFRVVTYVCYLLLSNQRHEFVFVIIFRNLQLQCGMVIAALESERRVSNDRSGSTLHLRDRRKDPTIDLDTQRRWRQWEILSQNNELDIWISRRFEQFHNFAKRSKRAKRHVRGHWKKRAWCWSADVASRSISRRDLLIDAYTAMWMSTHAFRPL